MTVNHYNKKIDRYALYTVILIIFHTISNITWIFLNNVFPYWDAAFHTVMSMKYYDYLANHFDSFYFPTFLSLSSFYPPFMYWVGALLAAIGGMNHKAIQLSGTMFFAAALIFIFLYVRDLYKNGRVAFLSAFFFSFFLYSFKESRDHMLDMPTTALFMASLFVIGRSKHLTSRKYTLIFFGIVALSFLIKWIAVIYFFLPLLVEVIYWVRQLVIPRQLQQDGGSTHNEILKQLPASSSIHDEIGIQDDKLKSRQRLFRGAVSNSVIGVSLGLALNAPWYLVNIQRLLTYSVYYAGGEEYSQVGGHFSLANLIFYPKLIMIFHLTLIGTLFFLMSAVIFFKDKTNKHRLWVLLAIFFYYAVFTMITNKTARYVIPFMPFIAIIMAYGLNFLIDKAHKHIVPALFGAGIMIWYVFTFFVVSFGIPIYPQYQYAIKLPIFGYVDVYYLNTYPVRILYDNADWRNREIAETILQELPVFDQRLILVNIDRNYISPATVNLAMYEANKGVPINLEELDTGFAVLLKGKPIFEDESSFKNYINKADFVVNVTDNIGPKQAMYDFPVRSQIQQYFLQGKATNFRLVRTIPLQDGTKVLIHVRNR